MSRRDAIAEGIQMCKVLTARYLAGFDDASHTKQAPNLPNHAAWNLGHAAFMMQRAAERLDGRPLPDSDFIIGDLTRPPADPLAARGDPTRYHTETVAFASKPTADAGRYPPMARGVEIYNAACDRLSAAIRSADDAKLNQPTKWGQAEITLGELCLRLIFHNGFHTGEIADLRRALGLKSIFS